MLKATGDGSECHRQVTSAYVVCQVWPSGQEGDISDSSEEPLGPRLEFEALLAKVVDQGSEILRSQDRVRELLRVANDLTSSLDLPAVLRRIVEVSVELVDARFGAMGVIGDDGTLEQFLHVGMSPEEVAAIGHLPEGRGLLGALVDDPRAVRLRHLSDDPRSDGFPAHHPPMDSFLGVPIRSRGRAFGNLYLTDSRNGQFSHDDEEIVSALAATAGIAIENARLFEDSEFRGRWSTALVDLSRSLIGSGDGHEIDRFVSSIAAVARADLVTVAVVEPDATMVRVTYAHGLGADDLLGATFPWRGTPAEPPLASGLPSIVSDLGAHASGSIEGLAQLGHALLIPFRTSHDLQGLLCVARQQSASAFEERDLDMGVSFAGHVSVALERQAGHAARRRVTLLEDRNRIARDLHDHVIQRLFATGLNLQALARNLDEAASEGIMAQVREIDGAIGQIRESIFAIRSADDRTGRIGLRARVVEVVERFAASFERRPRVVFGGPVDLMSSDDLADDLTAALTELLSNVVRHAEATTAHVEVTVEDGHASVVVTDDGVGVGDAGRAGGLVNLEQRAEGRGGDFSIEELPEGGTRACWSAPI